MTAEIAPATGQRWRMRLGGLTYVVVAVDERFVYVKDARSPKKQLATSAGASPVGRRELCSEWRQID